MSKQVQLPDIPEAAQTSLVKGLLGIIAQLAEKARQHELVEQLRDWGIDMSTSQLDVLLTANHAVFQEEKDALLSIGLACSRHLTVDDTGARHPGKNGYTTHIGMKSALAIWTRRNIPGAARMKSPLCQRLLTGCVGVLKMP